MEILGIIQIIPRKNIIYDHQTAAGPTTCVMQYDLVKSIIQTQSETESPPQNRE